MDMGMEMDMDMDMDPYAYMDMDPYVYMDMDMAFVIKGFRTWAAEGEATTALSNLTLHLSKRINTELV
jgi:hypothetical protein